MRGWRKRLWESPWEITTETVKWISSSRRSQTTTKRFTETTAVTIFQTSPIGQDWEVPRFLSSGGGPGLWTLITTVFWTFSLRMATSIVRWTSGTGAQHGPNGHNCSAISMGPSFRKFRRPQEAAWLT